MGVVYEVEHEHTGQRVALKVIAASTGLAEDALERFGTEARAAGRIRSDHVVRITDAGVAEELGRAPFIVMEMLEGADLDMVTGSEPAKPTDVVEWLRQVARGLTKAHLLGIVHRDLKPENLFLSRRDDGAPLVKILDFGVAKIVAEGATQTRSGQLVGTPMYMAPEQAGSTDVPISPRTDGFALGLIAFKLLVGNHYWKSGTILQIVSQVALEPMVPASERGATFGAKFDDWFAKACARDPSRRFEGPIEQIEALAAVFGIEPKVTSSGSTDARVSDAARNLETAATLAASESVVISGSSSKNARRRGRRTAVLAVTVGVALAALVASVPRLIARSVTGPRGIDAASALPPIAVRLSLPVAESLAAPPTPLATAPPAPSAAVAPRLDGGSRASGAASSSRATTPPKPSLRTPRHRATRSRIRTEATRPARRYPGRDDPRGPRVRRRAGRARARRRLPADRGHRGPLCRGRRGRAGTPACWPSSFPAGSCRACMEEQCCSAAGSCASNFACKSNEECVAACVTGGPCADACQISAPAGTGEEVSVLDVPGLASKCSAACDYLVASAR